MLILYCYKVFGYTEFILQSYCLNVKSNHNNMLLKYRLFAAPSLFFCRAIGDHTTLILINLFSVLCLKVRAAQVPWQKELENDTKIRIVLSHTMIKISHRNINFIFVVLGSALYHNFVPNHTMLHALLPICVKRQPI